MARGEAQSRYKLGVPGIYMGAPTWLCEPPMGANQTEKRSGAEPRAKETEVAAEPSETSTSRRGPKSTACMHIRDSCSNKHAPACSPTCTHTHAHAHAHANALHPCTDRELDVLPAKRTGNSAPGTQSCVFRHFKAVSYSITYMGHKQLLPTISTVPASGLKITHKGRGVLSHE